jgi:hypothetical protein
MKKKHFIFIIQNNNKNKKHIKIKKFKIFEKKLKHEPSLKKPGDFTVAEGHGHPLVSYNIGSAGHGKKWVITLFNTKIQHFVLSFSISY